MSGVVVDGTMDGHCPRPASETYSQIPTAPVLVSNACRVVGLEAWNSISFYLSFLHPSGWACSLRCTTNGHITSKFRRRGLNVLKRGMGAEGKAARQSA
jgi:hypothetical protein